MINARKNSVSGDSISQWSSIINRIPPKPIRNNIIYHMFHPLSRKAVFLWIIYTIPLFPFFICHFPLRVDSETIEIFQREIRIFQGTPPYKTEEIFSTSGILKILLAYSRHFFTSRRPEKVEKQSSKNYCSNRSTNPAQGKEKFFQ